MKTTTSQSVNIRPAALALCSALCIACGVEVQVAEDPTAPQSPETPETKLPLTPPETPNPSSPKPPTEPPPPTPLACQPLCETLSDNGCMTQESCLSSCEEQQAIQPFDETEGEAFRVCMESDPLCFVQPRDCMLHVLHPEPFQQQIRIRLDGFEDYENLQVHTGLSHGNALIGQHTTLVKDGSFELVFEETLHINSSRLVLFYIDVNGNNSCDIHDFVKSETVPVTGPASEPVFELQLQRQDLNSTPSMCPFI